MILPRDRVVLVTGGSSGIGRAVADAFLADGARVAVASRREVARPELFWVRADVRRRDDVERAVAAVVERFGALHVLVNNAGMGLYAPVERMRDEDLEDVFRTNVHGPVYAVRAALPHLRRTRGQVVNISSTLARSAIPYAAAYCMSKHALHAFSLSLRVELRPYGIRVIEVGPGFTETEFQTSARLTAIARPLVRSEGVVGWPPEKVARAVLRASRRGAREVWLTLDGRFFIFLQRAFPRLADWGLARWARGIAIAPAPEETP